MATDPILLGAIDEAVLRLQAIEAPAFWNTMKHVQAGVVHAADFRSNPMPQAFVYAKSGVTERHSIRDDSDTIQLVVEAWGATSPEHDEEDALKLRQDVEIALCGADPNLGGACQSIQLDRWQAIRVGGTTGMLVGVQLVFQVVVSYRRGNP